MRSVVGGDDIKDTVDESLQEQSIVLRRAEGRVHLVRGVIVPDVLMVEDEVVRGDFASDLDAFFLEPTDGVHTAGGGDMLDVNVRPGVLGDADVAVQANLLTDGGDAFQTEAVGHLASCMEPFPLSSMVSQ